MNRQSKVFFFFGLLSCQLCNALGSTDLQARCFAAAGAWPASCGADPPDGTASPPVPAASAQPAPRQSAGALCTLEQDKKNLVAANLT